MGYPYDNDDDYLYGLTDAQIRERMNYAIHGDDSESDSDFGDLDDLEPDADDDDIL